MSRLKSTPHRLKSTPNRAQPRRPRGYDVPMLKDFFQHLLWEVRIEDFEVTAAPGSINPELVEALDLYVERYGPVGMMLPATQVPGDSPARTCAHLPSDPQIEGAMGRPVVFLHLSRSARGFGLLLSLRPYLQRDA